MPSKISNQQKLKKNNERMRVFYNLAVFGKDELDQIHEVFDSFMIVGGKKTREFEEKIAKMFGKKHCLMVNSGSSANLLAVELLNLPRGSEVITPAVTFGTTLSPLFLKGLVPVFVDVELGTYQINVNHVERLISDKTKAIFVPSLMGNIPDYIKLRKIADKHKLFLIEDSCDTLGAKLDGKPTGVYSDISTTSFYAAHVITTGGHGGAICFNRDDWLVRAKTLASWGRSSARNETEDINVRFTIDLEEIPYDAKFVFEELGYNFQSSDIDAAFGLGQLKKFNKNFKTRQKNFRSLHKFFQNYKKHFILAKENPKADTCWLAFPLIIKDDAPFNRRELATFLELNGIQTRPFFTGNALRQPAFKNLEYRSIEEGYPVADLVMRGSLVIGCHHGMDAKQLNYVKRKFKEFLKRYS